jgi:hypothetical protein
MTALTRGTSLLVVFLSGLLAVATLPADDPDRKPSDADKSELVGDKSEQLKQDATKPEATKPDASKPDGVKPDKQDETKPAGTKPEQTTPDKQDETKPGTRPEQTKPEGTKPDGTKPETKPGSTKPDTKPETTKPAGDKPETVKLDSTKQDETKPEQAKPDATKPDGVKPDSTKPEQTKPDTTKPDATKPDQTKPEQTKPDTKPEQTKPDGTKPDQTKPDGTKPEGDKPGRKDDGNKSDDSSGNAAERAATALEFTKANHPELAELLEQLHSSNPAAFKNAVDDLIRAHERLARVQERSPDRYESELALWKLDSRIRLLAAQSAMKDADDVRVELKGLLSERRALRLTRMKEDRERQQARLQKLDESIAEMEAAGDEAVDNELEQLLGQARKRVREVTSPTSVRERKPGRTAEQKDKQEQTEIPKDKTE